MSKETGGTAFPFVSNGGIQMHQFCEGGITLRDYLAAKAMQSVSLAIDQNEQQLIANASYQMADAMLVARSK